MSETGQKIIAEVKRIALADPDFRYDEPADAASCVYVHQGCPSCLIGQALWSLGYIDASLEYERAPRINGEAIQDLLAWLELDLDEYEVQWLMRVQTLQDNGEAWGKCVEIP